MDHKGLLDREALKDLPVIEAHKDLPVGLVRKVKLVKLEQQV